MKQPGYSNFNKRVGLDTNTLGGKPRSLEFSEGEEIVNKEEKVDKKNEKKDEEDGETVVNSVEEEKERRRREATDGNGNRVLQVYRLKIKKNWEFVSQLICSGELGEMLRLRMKQSQRR